MSNDDKKAPQKYEEKQKPKHADSVQLLISRASFWMIAFGLVFLMAAIVVTTIYISINRGKSKKQELAELEEHEA